MSRILVSAVALLTTAFVTFATAAPNGPRPATERQIDYRGFQHLANEVYAYRAQRLVTLAQFQTMAREPNTIILDARSAEAYREGHIEGAINLSLTDFTAPALAAVLKPNTRILIYCNNNFENNARPVVTKMPQLSLNIQTFINLYGYGYKNVYELGEIVNFNDPKVRWVRGAQ